MLGDSQEFACLVEHPRPGARGSNIDADIGLLLIAKKRSALTSRSRTRSRSSPVAMRVNVTSRSCSSGMPSQTYRAASPAIVYVLPVPALASRTVTPVGSGPHRSNWSRPL